MRTLLGSVLALLVLAAGAWRLDVHRQQGKALMRHRRRLEDRNNLRNIVGLAVSAGKLPMRDGAFDPYELVRNSDLAGLNFKILRSRRLGIGPTKEEAEAGDYTNFPWERYRGERRLGDGPPFPLLWDKEPDEDGIVDVALSDGSVQEWDRERVERALSEAGVGR